MDVQDQDPGLPQPPEREEGSGLGQVRGVSDDFEFDEECEGWVDFLKAAAARVGPEARRKAFAVGTFVTYVKDHCILREWSDGSIQDMGPTTAGLDPLTTKQEA